jgi:hypothetical protein
LCWPRPSQSAGSARWSCPESCDAREDDDSAEEVERGNLVMAEMAARKVGKLTLAEARDLLCLYAAAQDATALGATKLHRSACGNLL